MLAENFADGLFEADGDGEGAEEGADIHPEKDQCDFPTVVGIDVIEVQQVAGKAESAEQFLVKTGEEKEGGDRGEVREEGVFEPLANVEGFAGSAETAEEGADVGVLAKFEDGDGAEDKGNGEAQEPGHGAAPLGLAGLEGLQFLDHADGALNLRRIFFLHREQILNGRNKVRDGELFGLPAEDNHFDVTDSFSVR